MAQLHSLDTSLESIPRDIHSISCFIAGFRYHEGMDITTYLVPGEQLDLIAEPDNQYDPFAVRIEHHKSRIGYIPRAHNQIVSRWLREQTCLKAHLVAVDWERPPWEAVQIRICNSV